MLATLRRRNFALLWCAGLISLFGDRAMMTALPFYVYQQTSSTLATAALFTAAYLPMVLLGSVAGVFVDRWDRKRIMVLTNLIQAFVMLLLLLVRSSTWLWLVLLVAFVAVSVTMFSQPAERALLPRLVGEDHLVPANALAGLNDNIARLAGPPIGGTLLGFLGLGSVAIMDSASFLIAAVLTSLISVSPRTSSEQVDVTDAVVSSWPQVWREWLDALKVVRKDRLIAALFVVLGVTSLGGTIIDPLYAPFVRSVLHGGAAALGWLSTTGALGGLLGGLIVGQFGHKVPPRHLTGVGTVAVAVLMLVMYHQTSLPAVMVLGFVMTVPVVGAGVGSSTLLQTGVPDAYRGRVFGALNTTAALVGLAGVGLAGIFGNVLGIVPMLGVAGAITLLAGVIALVMLPKGATQGESVEEQEARLQGCKA
ncbi:MAG TPA: MFS transporter [Chloroflexota bacterium]|nr:MFS transporter [Chloroflexota bacterium]